MTYRQYTECIDPAKHTSSPIIEAVAMGLFVALLDVVGVIMATGGFGLIAGGVAALLLIVTGLLSFVNWWLYGRLICLGGERCAIGMVVSVETPQEKSGFERLDSDYSFNLLLPPHQIGDTQATIEVDGLLGELIKAQAATLSIGLLTPGYDPVRSCDTDPPTAVLHAEFEGAGMYIFYQWLKVLEGILIAAAVASALCLVPVIGWIACAIAAVLGAVALLGVVAGMLHGMSDAAGPSDVNPDLGDSLQTNDCIGKGADLLVVSGEWVYDSLHKGWNEIHPVRHSQKIWPTGWDGTWPFDPADALKRWCAAIAEAGSALTLESQNKPENQWQVHPDVDGCQPEVVVT